MATSPRKRLSAGAIIERGIVWTAVALLLGFFVFTLLPPVTGHGRPASRTECKNHLKQLALAMHNYHDTYGSFPPAYVVDKNGRRMHSWRVLLLPFLEYGDLYKHYRLDEPWDGPHNRLLAEPAPSPFHCLSDTGAKTDTSYLVVVGPKTIFPGVSSIKIADITDGTSNTILLVEAVESGINWLEPRDMSYEEAARGINPKTGWGISSRHKEGGAQVAFADGSARYLADDTSIEELRRMLERDDGQPVSFHLR
jgi:prepilin-type processing-associated H-X9-DG protein